MASLYRVVRAHEPQPGDPLVLKKGDAVHVERKPTQWNGWLWCSKPTGEAGWAPEAWIKTQGDHGVAQRDYSALELAVQPGATLQGVLTESGWLLGISSNATTGWVPLDCVQLISPEADILTETNEKVT